jgi:transposase
MNPWPGPRSILILDNCRIHHTEELIDLVITAGCLIIYLPPYCPHLNPIEESFSKMKSHLRRYGEMFRQDRNPELALQEACGCVTGKDARSWFRHSGYAWNN